MLQKEFGTFGDVRAGWSMARSTTYNHLKNGDFKSRSIGGRRLIDLQSVRDYFASAPDNYKSSRLRVRQMKKAARASVKARRISLKRKGRTENKA
jgi:hypothetical protein